MIRYLASVLLCCALAAVATNATAAPTPASLSNYAFGWTYEDFAEETDKFWNKGWALHSVDSYVLNGNLRLNGVWKQGNKDTNYVLGWKWADFLKVDEQHRKDGLSLHDVDTYLVNGEVRFNAVWKKQCPDRTQLFGWKWDDFNKENAKKWEEGWSLVSIDTYPQGGGDVFNGVWKKGADNRNYVLGWIREDFDKKNAEYWAEGWALDAIDSYVVNGEERFNAVWQKGNSNRNYVIGWTRQDFENEHQKYRSQGWALHAVNSYVISGALRFNAIWHGDVPAEPLVGECNYERWLPDTNDLPYGAVGFVSNGCTGTLIDSRHIVTAAHCLFRENVASQYYLDLWFYPNFNAPDGNPARLRIDRAVVGSHGDTGSSYATSDWAIAHLASSASTTPNIPIGVVSGNYRNAIVVHYTRDTKLMVPKCNSLPYPDEYSCQSGATKPHGNVWWHNGLVNRGVVARDKDAGYTWVECASAGGGSSGSPHLVEHKPGEWRIVGVTHGSDCSSVQGAAAERFRYAPRFAASVAVSRSPSSSDRTGVYVLDSASNRIVYRHREATAVLSPFTYFGIATSVPPQSSRIASYRQKKSGLPGVLVLNSAGKLEDSRVSNGNWLSWSTIGTHPSGGFNDMDIAYDSEGASVVYANQASSGGKLYFNRRDKTSGKWQSNWKAIPTGDDSRTYVQVSALRHHGDKRTQVWALTDQGEIRTIRETAAGTWSQAAEQNLPALGASETIVDIDAGWSYRERAILIALSSEGRAWYAEASSTNIPTDSTVANALSWESLPSQVDPGVPVNRDGVRLVSVTASRWQETGGISGSGNIVPVVFATDTWGNVLQTTQRSRSGTMGWSMWIPFYGKRIEADQTIQD